jgi:hypothetical protein
MELSDEKVLEALLRDWEPRTSNKKSAPVRGSSASPKAIYEAPAKKSGFRRCQCGVCRTCEETERWERIFQTKFADPDYYARRSVPHVSPLADG